MYYLDKVNDARPKMYKDKGFYVKHSNLCAEIALFNDKDHSFTCVLSSMNIAKYKEWKDTKAIQIATVFLDAVISDMLIKAKLEEGFEKIVAFTEKSRAIGLGMLGLSTYFQQEGWAFGNFQSIQFNMTLMKELDRETLVASKLLAKEVGEPEWMVGYGERFSHRLALPPTKSTAIIQGGISEGINAVFANVYGQDTAGGTVYRINPVILPIMKERGVYTKEVMERIANSQGSVQGEDWLSPEEKEVFKTAFELNQETIIRMGSHRQRIMNEGGGGQGQSLNLFFQMEEPESEISRLHNVAFEDPYLQSLYYVHSLNEKSVNAVDKSVCESCSG
jgi:ribonucleoside-diphosphate reductase alpha chain